MEGIVLGDARVETGQWVGDSEVRERIVERMDNFDGSN